jgi:hypothetical protein
MPGDQIHASDPKGLCKSCDHAITCALPGRAEGVWRCNKFV